MVLRLPMDLISERPPSGLKSQTSMQMLRVGAWLISTTVLVDAIQWSSRAFESRRSTVSTQRIDPSLFRAATFTSTPMAASLHTIAMHSKSGASLYLSTSRQCSRVHAVAGLLVLASALET